MKITKTRLKEIIKEEIEAISEESKSLGAARSDLRQHYVRVVGDDADAGKIPHADGVRIDNLAAKVADKNDKMDMKDAKKEVSEM